MHTASASANANAKFEGVFKFGVLTGFDPRKARRFSKKDFKKAYIEAHQGTYHDILDFWKQFGSTMKMEGSSPNRIVENGLEIIIEAMSNQSLAIPVAAPTLPTWIQLGRGNTAWAQSQSSLIDAITTSGLQAKVSVVTQLVSGNAGAKKDQMKFAATFTTTSASDFATDGVNEACICTPSVAKLYARTTTDQEYNLTAINDQLVVDYKSRVMG